MWGNDRTRGRALRLRRRYEIRHTPSEDDLDAILADLGVDVTVDDLPGSSPELYVDGTVIIRRGLSHAWRRWVKAHVIKHRLDHIGDQLDLSRWLMERQEREADDFAGWLLFGPLPKSYRGELPATVRALAEWGEVPEEVVWPWWARAAPIGSGLRYA